METSVVTLRNAKNMSQRKGEKIQDSSLPWIPSAVLPSNLLLILALKCDCVDTMMDSFKELSALDIINKESYLVVHLQQRSAAQ